MYPAFLHVLEGRKWPVLSATLSTQSQFCEFCRLYFFCDHRHKGQKCSSSQVKNSYIKCNYICEKTIKACRSLKNSRILCSYWWGSASPFKESNTKVVDSINWETVAESLDHWPALSYISSHWPTYIQTMFLVQGERDRIFCGRSQGMLPVWQLASEPSVRKITVNWEVISLFRPPPLTEKWRPCSLRS